jgi:hypothetical protein
MRFTFFMLIIKETYNFFLIIYINNLMCIRLTGDLLSNYLTKLQETMFNVKFLLTIFKFFS